MSFWRSEGAAGARMSTVRLASLSLMSCVRTSSASVALLEATTKCFPEPEYLPASTEMAITTAKITGMRMVVILKALPRTCSRYSRLAMRRMSRIDCFSYSLDEDFFEGRLDEFEFI